MTIGLTARQMDLLRFIAGYQIQHDGISPTLRECMIGMGLVGKASIHRELVELERRGRIRRLTNRHRAIEIVSAPPVCTAPDGAPLYFVRPRSISVGSPSHLTFDDRRLL